MKLERLSVRHFRGIPRVSFEGLSDRINLFYGPNEVGKSTLVEALHFALFERATGQAEYKKALRTWGGTETPEVEVTFVDDDGQRWDVRKRFLDRPETEIYLNDSIRVTGKDAESRLRQLLGTRTGTSRGIPRADLGIWPLVWVRQGTAGWPTRDALNDDTRAALSATLSDKTGLTATSSGNRAVVQRVFDLYREHWTEGGRPTAVHRRVIEAAQQAALQVADLEDQVHATRVMADDLRRAEAEAARLDKRVSSQRSTLEQARSVAERAARAREALEVEERAEELARVAHEQACQRVRQVRGLRETLDASADRARAASEDLDQRAEERTRADEDLRAARRELEDVETALTAARAVLRTLERAELRDALQTQLDALQERCASAEAASAELRKVRDAAASTGVTVADAGALEEAVRRLQRAEATVEASSARLVLTTQQDLHIDGELVSAGTTRVIPVRDAGTLEIAGVLTLGVQGDGAPEAARQELWTARAAVERLLVDMGVEDVDTARARAAARKHLEAEAVPLRARLDVLAPEGVAPLRAERRQLASRLGAIPAVDAGPEDRARAKADVERLEVRHAAARARLDAVEITTRGAREAHAECQAVLVASRAEVRRLESELSGQPSLHELESGEVAALRALEDAKASCETQRSRFQGEGGTLAARRFREERAALEQLETRRTTARSEAERCRVRLEQRADEGLYSKLVKARVVAWETEQAAARATRSAQIARRTHTAILDAQRALQHRFAEPVRRVVQDGVALLFPGSTLAFDEDGEVVGLRTGGVVEAFDDLSGGAREQLGVLVRLGLARVLAEGRRLPVILDDALVNSDAERRARMVEVLRRASDHLQLLVFTSHDEDFDRLAADFHVRVEARPRRVY
jgi:DNA repair exonuclease SbcCD ATPase subunit